MRMELDFELVLEGKQPGGSLLKPWPTNLNGGGKNKKYITVITACRHFFGAGCTHPWLPLQIVRVLLGIHRSTQGVYRSSCSKIHLFSIIFLKLYITGSRTSGNLTTGSTRCTQNKKKKLVQILAVQEAWCSESCFDWSHLSICLPNREGRTNWQIQDTEECWWTEHRGHSQSHH